MIPNYNSLNIRLPDAVYINKTPWWRRMFKPKAQVINLKEELTEPAALNCTCKYTLTETYKNDGGVIGKLLKSEMSDRVDNTDCPDHGRCN